MNASACTLRGGIEMALRLFIGTILLVSSFMHLANPYYFLSSIYSFQLVPEKVGYVAAMVLPFLQLVGALGLWLSPLRLSSYWICVSLFTLYLAVQIIALARGLNISCGCFGAEFSGTMGRESLLFTSSCLFASLLGCFLEWKARRPSAEVRHAAPSAT